MKRFCILVVCAIFILSGCGSKSEKNNSIDDYAVMGLTSVSDDGIYHLVNDNFKKLYFYDFKAKKDIPLCSKVNCNHDNEDCDAYTLCFYKNEDLHLAFAPIYYQDKLYYFYENTTLGDVYFCVSDLNGTNIKEIKKISELSVIDCAMIYDNKLWYTENTLLSESSVNDSTLSTHFTSKVMDLSNRETTTIQEDDNIMAISRGAFDGNVYFSTMDMRNKENIIVTLQSCKTDDYKMNTVIDDFNIPNSFIIDKSMNFYNPETQKINKINIIDSTKEDVMDITIPEGYTVSDVMSDDHSIMTFVLAKDHEIFGEMFVDLLSKKVIDGEDKTIYTTKDHIYRAKVDGTVYED